VLRSRFIVRVDDRQNVVPTSVCHGAAPGLDETIGHAQVNPGATSGSDREVGVLPGKLERETLAYHLSADVNKSDKRETTERDIAHKRCRA